MADFSTPSDIAELESLRNGLLDYEGGRGEGASLSEESGSPPRLVLVLPMPRTNYRR